MGGHGTGISVYKESLLAFLGVKLTLSGLVDGKNFSAGGHKVGLGFELEA